MSNLPIPHPDPEVDFVNLAKTIWKRRLLVIKLTGIAAVAGIMISIMIPNQYIASITLVQEKVDPLIKISEARLSAISALAAVAGVDLNGLTRAKMAPPTFLTIISSVPFRQELLKTKLNLGKTDSATLYDYYTKEVNSHPLITKIKALPNKILRTLRGGFGSHNSRNSSISQTDSIPQLTPEELEINKILDKQISLRLHDDEYVTISCTLPEAYAVAQLTRSAAELLQRFLTDIQTEKARANLKFVQERYDEARMDFLKIREELSAMPANKESESLSTSSRLAENVYLELARKLEQSKIALNEQKPIFRTINPVTVPIEHSYPNRLKITLIFSFFGLVMAVVSILGKGFFEDTKEKWKR